MKHVILKKAEVQPFSRIRRGKLERVKGWLLPEKYKISSYYPDTRGVMDFVKDHMGVEEYGKIITRAVKESTYVMEGVNSAFLDVANKGKGTLERMIRRDPEGLKRFLGALFDHVSADTIAVRKDLRKAKALLEKARAKKYIRREGSPGNWKYVYQEKKEKETGFESIAEVLTKHGWKAKKGREWAAEVTYTHNKYENHEVIVNIMKDEWVHYGHRVEGDKWIGTDKHGEGKGMVTLSSYLDRFHSK